MTSTVASETLSYCTSCKIDLNHRIVAMKEDLIVKVQCLTCKKEHKYRSPKGLVEPKPVKVKKVEIQEEFDLYNLKQQVDILFSAIENIKRQISNRIKSFYNV